jgi:hypothetical protein
MIFNNALFTLVLVALLSFLRPNLSWAEAVIPPETLPSQSLTATTLIAQFADYPLYWPEYKFWLRYSAKTHNQSQQAVSNQAIEYACNDRAIEAAAVQEGLTISQVTLEGLEQERQKNIKIYGSASEYFRMVVILYGSETVYRYLQHIDALSVQLFNHWYGSHGQKIGTQDVDDYLHKKRYLSAYYLTLPLHDSLKKPLNRAQKQHHKKQLAQWRQQVIKAKNPLATFKNLIKQYSDDPKVGSFPNGRQFIPGTFSSALEAEIRHVKSGQLSEVIEDENGLHLVMPILLIPTSFLNGTGKSLTYWTAYDGLFKARITGICKAMSMKISATASQIDLNKVLGKRLSPSQYGS